MKKLNIIHKVGQYNYTQIPEFQFRFNLQGSTSIKAEELI